jgi:hypothetical protein
MITFEDSTCTVDGQGVKRWQFIIAGGSQIMSVFLRPRAALTRDGGPDAPWRAWREDGTKFRADTLAGLKRMITRPREAVL